MTDLVLPALDGRTPLGFLAALGVQRLVTVHAGQPARLSWSPRDCTAILADAYDSLDELVAALQRIVDAIPAEGVLPGVPADLPPPGEAPDRLRLPRPALRDLIEGLREAGESEAEAWMSSLVTDLTLDEKSRADISLFAAPSGKQSMRTMLEKPLQFVRAQPHVLREALEGWRRYPGVTGEYLDHRVLFDAADSPTGKSQERGVPGATWLALMSYPLMHTTAQGRHPMTTCWQRAGKRPGDRRMVYPLWSAPLDLTAVAALLRHPVLQYAADGTVPAPARVLSVFAVGRAQRRRIPGRTFAGVLAPAP